MSPNELEILYQSDMLKHFKDVLESKLDMFNGDHKVTKSNKETTLKSIKRKLNFINKKI